MKVVIIGAGPAGSTTAETILKLNPNNQVTIVEKKNVVGENPRCAGGVNALRFSELRLEVPEDVIAAKVTRCRIYSPNNDCWELDAKTLGIDRLGSVFHRDKFDAYLAERAMKLGAEIRTGIGAKDIKGSPPEGLRGLVSTSDGEMIPFDVLVIAWGSAPFRTPEFHHAVQAIANMDYPQDLISLYFGQKIAPSGYAWIFPNGNKTVKIGLGMDCSHKQNPMDYLGRFVTDQNLVENSVISRLVPTSKPPKSGVVGKTLFVGDSLPACDPLHGGGIINAIITGRCAGRAIAGGFPNMYDKYWRQELYGENMRRYRMKKLLYSFRDEDFDMLVSTLKEFTPQSLSVGKEMSRALLHLAKRAPHLIGKKLIKGWL